jgi:lysozyme family protein
VTFDEAFAKLIDPQHEGTYSNNPADPGGETMYGITARVARANGYQGEMKNLPLSEAKRIARAEYWDAVRADELPEAVRFDVFDGAYNSSPGQSIKWLQSALGAIPDGKLGPATLAACFAIDQERLLSRYNGWRLDFLNDLKTWPTFGKGWAQRIATNLKAA